MTRCARNKYSFKIKIIIKNQNQHQTNVPETRFDKVLQLTFVLLNIRNSL